MRKFRKRIVSAFVLICFSTGINAQYIGQDADLISVQPNIAVKAYSYKLQDVRLLDSRFKENMERDKSWLMRLNLQRLLHSWRVNAGIKSNAKPYDGWERLDCEVRGGPVGHVLTAFALMYASTGDSTFKKKGDSLVVALAECQRVLNQDGYLSAFPQHLIDRCIAGEPVWAPWYTIHKIMAGLTDMYLYANNKQALELATKMSGWAYRKLNKLTPEQQATNLKNEFGGMIEISYNLFAITGNKEDLALADLFYDHTVLDSLSENKDILNKLHANTQIPKLIGEARGYELTGTDKQRKMADFFWNTVHDHHTYAIGGNSDWERFFEKDKISQHIAPLCAETCNSYNMLKLTRHLFSWTGDVKYADYYEQTLYNHILAAQDPETGMASYFMPQNSGAFKVYSKEDSSFWCCVCTGFESNAKFPEAIYYHDDKGIFVNLFIPSELNWREKRVRIIQETKYPEEATTNLRIEANEEVKLPIYIRYPSWATNGVIVTVNGKLISIHQKQGSYITIDRKWKSGDKVQVTFPMSLRLVATNDNPDRAAIAYGPIILVGEAGKEGLTKAIIYDVSSREMLKYKIPSSINDKLNAKGKNVTDWIKPIEGQPLTFKTEGVSDKPFTLIPYYKVHDERYIMYWNLQ